MSRPLSPSVALADVPRARLRRHAALTLVTSLAIFMQAVTAGQFVSQEGRDGWITVHGAIADVAWVLALLTAVAAAVFLRRAIPRLVAGSAILFVLTLGQTGIGHLITDDGQDWLIAVHVPLAFAIFGLTVWLSVRTVAVARSHNAATPLSRAPRRSEAEKVG